MENNLNHSGIEEYCSRFCKKLVSEHFQSHDVITGKQILELQEIRQINLFVIRNLLAEWRKEASKIQSPYFNYEDPEVKVAFKEFMNILSRHIAIKEENFRPLFHKATKDALLLIFSPYDYYTHLIHDPGKKELSLKELQRTSKYVKINNNLLQELIRKIQEHSDNKIAKKEAARLLNEVFQDIQESPEDVEGYMSLFSKTEPLTESMIYGEAAPAPTEKASAPFPPSDEPYQKPDEETKTLNDIHSGEQKPTLADLHRKQKIESIRKHISINQRFMFINVLFNGDEASFNRTIEHIEECQDSKSAKLFLSSEYPDWDEESEEVEEFMELIEKRLP